MGFFLNMIFVLLLGRIIQRVLQFLRYRIRFLYSLLSVFWRFGVIFHELSHFIMFKILLIPVKFSDVDFHTNDGGGVVKCYKTEEYYRRMSFLKDLLISVAPLWLGTCAIMELYNVFVNNDLLGTKIGAAALIIITMYAFVPSSADMKGVIITIGEKPFVFVKQMIFLVISFLIYNLYFDFFYQFAPIYPYLFEFFMLLVLEGSLELTFMVVKFGIGKIFAFSNNQPLGFYRGGSGNVSEMFPSRKQRRKIKAMQQSELFTLLPYDDETAAEEFAQAMIENNAMMIDIENPEDEP